MIIKIRNWMERFLQEPFYQAEVIKAEIEDQDQDLMVSLVDSLNHNYHTLKSWSK